MARRMGYGKTFQDFKCNVHIAGKAGPAGINQPVSRTHLKDSRLKQETLLPSKMMKSVGVSTLV